MKIRLLLIILFVIGIILFPLISNLTVIKARIICSIEYDVQGSNSQEIINKVEKLNYTALLNNYIERNLDLECFIDADFIGYLKGKVENDTKFHWLMGYEHHLKYSFIAENHSTLYMSYNNYTIFNVKDKNNQSLLSADDYHWERIVWYLNFTQLSYVYSSFTTISVSNATFIKMHLNYGYYCGSVCALYYSIDQYLVLNANLDALMIFIPYKGVVVA